MPSAAEVTIQVVSFAATKKRFGVAPQLKSWKDKPLAAVWDEGAKCYKVMVTHKGVRVPLHIAPEDAKEVAANEYQI